MTTYTTSPTETLRHGDVVVFNGERFKVYQCENCERFFLMDSKGADSTLWQHLELPRLTEIVRKEFTKLAPNESPKEVPPLAVGQKWRTRGGETVVIGNENGHSYTAKEWWYSNHNSNKRSHSPGLMSSSHPDTLVELIADAPAPAPEKAPAKDDVTLVLSRDEAQAVYQVLAHFVVGNGPARKKTSSVFWKLSDMGFNNVKGYPLKVCPQGILCYEVKEPLFRLNEVWRTEGRYLVRLTTVSPDFSGSVRVVHNPKGAPILYSSDGTYDVSADGSISGWNDKLVEKISD